MRLVVDASVATKWLVPEDNSDIANDLTVAGHELLAPRLMAFEVGNTLWRKARRGEIDQGLALQLADMISAMPVVWMDNESLNLEAIHLALSAESSRLRLHLSCAGVPDDCRRCHRGHAVRERPGRNRA